jgi:formyltetrahydrofolate deformylase
MHEHYILTLSCPDAANIVAAVAGFVAKNGGFINESTQFGDATSSRFFLRMDWHAGETTPDKEAVEKAFTEEVADPFGMTWQLRRAGRKQRMILMVSKAGHCLNDLLHRYRTGALPVEIPAVISNHEDLREIVEWHGVPFHYLPVTRETKMEQEAAVLKIFEDEKADLLVLARYMQILSPGLSAKLAGKAINIHHSFLPGFKGARPYHQAYERGVKLIGATAHYVTDDLDEGPIIEQEVTRVDHSQSPEELVAIGRDIESVVLARAVQYHCQHRVLLNGNKTVVFR